MLFVGFCAMIKKILKLASREGAYKMNNVIKVKYDKPKKMSSEQSIYITFKYNAKIVDVIRLISERYWDSKNKVWELPYDALSELQSILKDYTFEIEGKPINNKKYREKVLKKKFELPKLLKTNLYQFQIDCFNEVMNFDKYLILDEPGCGKSVESIAIALKRKEIDKTIKHCLIIACVNGLKYNWQDEIKEHTGMDSLILGNRKNKKGQWQVKSNEDKYTDLQKIYEDENNYPYFIITNIETLRNKQILDLIKTMCKKKIFNIAIIDEIHKARNSTSIQGRALLSISKELKYFYGLTGTVIKNNPLDMYVPLKCVGKEQANFTQFKYRYCIFGGFGGYQIIGNKHLDELQKKLNDVSIRRRKEDVLDLPSKIYMTEYVEMGDKQKKIYNDILKVIMEDIDNISLSVDPLSQMIRLRQATADTSILSTTIKESAKYERLHDIVDEVISNGSKVVVFSNWVQVINRVIKEFKNYNPAIITGEIKDRETQKKKFLENDNCKIIFGTIGAMGTGLTLTVANTAIFLDEPYTFADLEQAADRIYRIGTKESVNIISLICKNTIDEKIHQIVMRKKKLSDGIIDKKYDLHDPNVIKWILE